MGWVANFLGSTVGKKFLMGLTGVVGLGFVFAHMLGNLLVYAGPQALNAYGETLQGNKVVLWGIRGVLLTSVVVHFILAAQLTALKKAARPESYKRPGNIQAKPGSRSMILSGLVLAAFIGYHILHFTVGNVHNAFIKGNVYHNVITGFQVPLVGLFYIVAMLLLGLHLSHGGYALFSSLGLIHPKYQKLFRNGSYAIVFAVVIGNVSIPLAVMLGFLKPVAS